MKNIKEYEWIYLSGAVKVLLEAIDVEVSLEDDSIEVSDAESIIIPVNRLLDQIEAEESRTYEGYVVTYKDAVLMHEEYKRDQFEEYEFETSLEDVLDDIKQDLLEALDIRHKEESLSLDAIRVWAAKWIQGLGRLRESAGTDSINIGKDEYNPAMYEVFEAGRVFK